MCDNNMRATFAPVFLRGAHGHTRKPRDGKAVYVEVEEGLAGMLGEDWSAGASRQRTVQHPGRTLPCLAPNTTQHVTSPSCTQIVTATLRPGQRENTRLS